MMQLHTFPQGGFVAHKVQLSGMESRYSIWCNALGALTDAARIDAAGKAYPVNRASNLWARLSGRSAIIIANHSRAIGLPFCGTITKGF